MPLFVVFETGDVFPFNRFTGVPERGVLVNAKSSEMAKLQGEHRAKTLPKRTATKPAISAVRDTLPTVPETPVAKAPQNDIHKASARLSDLIERLLDDSDGDSKMLRVSRETLVEAFGLADYVATNLEEK